MNNLSDYMNSSIKDIIKSALKASLKDYRETVFLLKYGLAHRKAVKKRQYYEKKVIHIPPFLIASITTNCNLFCKGCYARENKACGENLPNTLLSSNRWSEIFSEGRKLGTEFILLAGGEPLMRRDVIIEASKYKDIIFPVFTNGTLINEAYVELFNKNRNLVPVLSIEGNAEQTDERRGSGTYNALLSAMSLLHKKNIFYGASVTITKKNLHTVAGEEFISTLHKQGCKVVLYVEYVPMDKSTIDLAPGNAERELLEDLRNDLRKKFKDIMFISFPGDEKYTGGCLAAGRGFFHINANGSAEPCPFSPYSDTSLKNSTLLDALQSPLFKKLDENGILMGEHIGGCQLFEREQDVKSLLKST